MEFGLSPLTRPNCSCSIKINRLLVLFFLFHHSAMSFVRNVLMCVRLKNKDEHELSKTESMYQIQTDPRAIIALYRIYVRFYC